MTRKQNLRNKTNQLRQTILRTPSKNSRLVPSKTAAAKSKAILLSFKTLFASWPAFQAGYDRLFSLPITLWYMVYQRLHADHSLQEVVDDLHDGGADSLGKSARKPLSKRILSRATTAYSNARQRLSLSTLASALGFLNDNFHPSENCLWHGFRVLLADGSTFRMRPLGNIPKVFAPHANQYHKKIKTVTGVWLVWWGVSALTPACFSLARSATRGSVNRPCFAA